MSSMFNPGTEVHLDETRSVTVYPLGIAHFGEFSRKIEHLWPTLKRNELLDGDIRKNLIAILPLIAADLIDIVDKCVDGANLTAPDSGIPHWHLPKILEAWIDASFGSEEKIRPWIEVVESTIHKVTKEEINLWSSLSKSLSQADTTSTSS